VTGSRRTSGLLGHRVDGARGAGCEWLHVDWDDEELTAFYIDACGFVPTKAGLIPL
jgi:hypothetical protein